MPISRFDLHPILETLNGGGTVLVPSLRIKDAILAEIHSQQSLSSYITPKVEPIDVWLKSLWEIKGMAGQQPCCDRQLMSGSQELFIWTEIIEKSSYAIPLLNPEDTAAQVSQSYQDIQQWALWDTLLDGSAHYRSNLDVDTFINWAKAYQVVCQEKQIISLVDCTRMLINAFKQGDNDFLPEVITLSNFDDPPPLYSKLFESLKAVSNLGLSKANPLPDSATAKRYVFSRRDQEIKSCAQWAHTLSLSDPSAHIGIIMPSAAPDKGDVIRLFEDLYDSQRTIAPLDNEALFNSTGDTTPLINFGIIHDAFTLLSLFAGDQDSNEVCRLLQSPYLFPQQEEMNALLQAQILMRRTLSSRCSVNELSGVLSNPKLPSHSPLFADSLLQSRTLLRGLREKSTPRQWATAFQSILLFFQWPGDFLPESEKKLHTHWEESINTFAESASTLGLLNHHDALKKLHTLLSQLSPRPGFSSRRQLSFYTVSEAIGLRFDHAWLLGFDDQSWPPPSSPSPFLPYELQRQNKMPASHGENQYAMAQQSFSALTSAVKKSLVYSHYETDSDQQLRPSSFIRSTPADAAEIVDDWPLNRYSKDIIRDIELTVTTDSSIPALTESTAVRGGQSVLSDQSSCPFRAFSKHRLNADRLQEFSVGLSSMARGSALHIALEAFYADIADLDKLSTLSPEELGSRITCATAEALDYLNRNYQRVMTPRYAHIEQTRLGELLQLFVNLDLQREKFELVAQEKTYQWQHGNLQLTLKMDRVDQLEDNTLALIDYKTGKHTPTRQSWVAERPEDIQLPLYFVVASAIEDKAISALSIAHVNAEKIGYSGLAATASFGPQIKPVNEDDKIDQNWDQLAQLWTDRVSLLADEFVSGKANVSPVQNHKTCEYCGLQALCRVQELRESLSSGELEPPESSP